MVNTNLPITAFRAEIIEAVQNHRVVVITAETGAGKSTQVPQFLLEEGYRVVVTQPRRLAARTLAERVAEEVEVKLGGLVGFRTAFERSDSRETRILFVTDGLQLVRELTGNGQTDVLVIDEVHEWNLNIETLVAWTRKRLSENADFRLILMSATLEAEKLASFYGTDTPVISVPGRLFPVEERSTYSADLVPTVKRLVGEGRNVLVFQPGKREISDTIQALQGLNAEIFPLHGEIEPAEQRRAFRHYDRPKVVVATNVAQTSITIDDIDAVVDSGVERRVELVNGIEGLYLKPVSQADMTQRKGRAGRTKAGIYVLASETSKDARPAFPKAEIERVRLDQMVLRLVEVGFDATALEFFHQPDRATLADAKRALKALGAMAEDGSVTKTGRLMAKLPVSVQFARMVVEAQARGVVDDVLTISALLEVGGIRDRSNFWRQFTRETESDLLAELDLWEAAIHTPGANLRDIGVFAKSFFQAKELRNKLRDALRDHGVKFGSTGNRQDILRSCVAGMVDHLYREEYGYYRNGGSGNRQLARESVVTGGAWVVAIPRDIQFKDRRGYDRTLNLITMVSKVDPSWLLEVAPQLGGTTRRSYRYDAVKSVVVCDLVTTFNGQEIKTEVVETDGPQAVEAFANAFAAGSVNHPSVAHNKAIRDEVASLNIRSSMTLGRIESSTLSVWYALKLGEICALADTEGMDLNLTDADMSDLLGKDFPAERMRIQRERPDVWIIADEIYGLTYKWDTWYFKGVEIRLPISVIAELTVEQLPQFEGLQTRVWVADEAYTSLNVTLPNESLDYLRSQIERNRQGIAWQQFVASDHNDYDRKVEVSYGEEFPALPEAEIWDQTTSASAYCAYVYYSQESGQSAKTIWYVRWFRTQEEALQKQQYAEQVKAQKDAQENERRNFDALTAEAQTLYQEVEGLYGQIDTSKAAAYGLSAEEAGSSWYGSMSLSRKLEEAKTQAFGSGWNKPQPMSAMESLKVFKSRIEQAIAHHAENAEKEAEAQAALESARTQNTQVNHAYYANVASYDEQYRVQQALSSAEQAFRSGDYIKALEQAAQVFEMSASILTKWKQTKRAQQIREALLQAEYTLCPVCGGEIYNSNHICSYDFRPALLTRGNGQTFVVKASYVGEEELMALVAEYDSRYKEYRFIIRSNEGVALENLTAVQTKTFWRQPSVRERELVSQIATVEQQLAAMQAEAERDGRVEVTFTEKFGAGDRAKIQGAGFFTGWINQEDFQNTPVIFSSRARCHWLDEQPQMGETWVCTTTHIIGSSKGRSVINVNPQMRVDDQRERQLQEELAYLQLELEELQNQYTQE